MSEILNNTYEASPGRAESQPDYPSFDPDKAKALKEDYREHYEEGETAEQKDIKPEELCDRKKMVEKLNQMGVSKEILGNPAFGDILGDIMAEYGLKASIPSSIKESDHTKASKEKLTLLYSGEKGDAAHHDRGEMRFDVQKDGSLILECGCADRNRMKLEEKNFKGYETPHSVNGRVDGVEERNSTSRIMFIMTQDGGLKVRDEHISEFQYRPIMRSINGKEASDYYEGYHKTERWFDPSGVEVGREDVGYKSPNPIEGHDMLKLGGGFERPDEVSFRLQHFINFNKLDSTRTRSYSRTPDNTMLIRDNSGGNFVEVETSSSNSSRIVPNIGYEEAIEAAHEAAKKDNQ